MAAPYTALVVALRAGTVAVVKYTEVVLIGFVLLGVLLLFLGASGHD